MGGCRSKREDLTQRSTLTDSIMSLVNRIYRTLSGRTKTNCIAVILPLTTVVDDAVLDNNSKEFTVYKKELENDMQRILEQAPGLARVHILNFQTTDEGSEARLNFFFYKKDTEEAERNSSLTVSEALTRWFELEWVKENYEAASKFGTPKVMAVEDLKAEEIVKEALKQGQEEAQDSDSSSSSSNSSTVPQEVLEEEQDAAQEAPVIEDQKTEPAEPKVAVEVAQQAEEEVPQEPESCAPPEQQEVTPADVSVKSSSSSASLSSVSSKSSKKSSRMSFLKRDWLACCGTNNKEEAPVEKAPEAQAEEKLEEPKEPVEEETPKKSSFLQKDWFACCGGSNKEEAAEDIEKLEEKPQLEEEKPVKQGTESEQIAPSQEESPKEQEQEETVQDEVKEVEQEDKLEEKPEPTIADDKDSEPESMGCCGLRRPRKSAAKPEEPKQEEPKAEEQEQEQEEKVTCCGMKKSSPSVDEELEVMVTTEQTLQPQKLEPIKEESTTGSEQLKRDSIPESQEVKQAETK